MKHLKTFEGKDPYKKGTKPKKEFNPSTDAGDWIQDMADKMGCSVEEAMKRISEFTEKNKKKS
jgi:hypothetical protein